MLKSISVDGFKQRCSWETLQSDERGLFSVWLAEVVKSNPGAVENLGQFSSEEERVLFISSLNKVDRFMVQPVYKVKDREAARIKRDEGNTAFHKKWYKQAHMLYSLSAVKAPAGDEILAYSLANRSACLYYLGEIKLCIGDANLALVSGYPLQLQYKLHERLSKCYILLKDKDNAIKSAVAAKKMLEKNKGNLNKEKYQSSMKNILKLGNFAGDPRGAKSDNITVVPSVEPDTHKVSAKPDKRIREFSSLIKVEYNPEVGRHVKADKLVRPGDTLVVEEPFASVLYPDTLGTNCDFCFAKLRAVVPCPGCSGVGFCSKDCRDKACSSYHRYECKYQDLVVGLGSSALVRLALRIITSHPLEYFKKMRHHLNVDLESREFKLPYLYIFNLVGLDGERWSEDAFARTLMAVGLLKVLKAAKYFPEKSEPDTFTDDEIFIGSLLLRHLNILQFNAHEVYELLRGSRENMKPSKNSKIGLAVYPKASYFNHSCHPHIAR